MFNTNCAFGSREPAGRQSGRQSAVGSRVVLGLSWAFVPTADSRLPTAGTNIANRYQPAPYPLQARRVVRRRVGGRHPGDALGAPGMGRGGQLVDYVLYLVDHLEWALDVRRGQVGHGGIGAEPLVICVCPLALLGPDPAVVDAEKDLLAVLLEVLYPARKCKMDPGLRQRLIDDDDHRGIPAGLVAIAVVFCPDADALLPETKDALLPCLGDGPATHRNNGYVSRPVLHMSFHRSPSISPAGLIPAPEAPWPCPPPAQHRARNRRPPPCRRMPA